MASAASRWRLFAAVLCAGRVLCVPVEQTTATVITAPNGGFGQPGEGGEVVLPVSEGDVPPTGVRRRNGVDSSETHRDETSSRERLVMQSLGLRCSGGDVLSCFMVELTDYFDGFMARSNENLLPGANLTQESPARAPSSSGEDPGQTSRSEDDAAPSLLQLLGRKAWAFARSYVLSLDLRPVADFVQEARKRGLLQSLEKAIGAGRSEKLTGSGIDLPIGSNDSGNDNDDDDDDDDDNDKDNSTRSTMTAIVLKTVVLGVLALKVMAILIAKVAVIMKVTAAAAVLALLFFHGFQKDISYQVVTQQNKPDSYEPDPHSHQEEYGGDSYSNNGGGGGYGGGYGGGGGNGGGGGGDWGRNGAAHNMAYRGQRRKQNG